MPESRLTIVSRRRSPIERGCGDSLVDLLHHDPIVRRYAIEGLQLDGLDAVALYALRDRLLDDSHAPVRLAAGERLARASAPRLEAGQGVAREAIVAWLTLALDDSMPSVREVACRALARHAADTDGCDAALARSVIRDPIWWVRRAAARALAAVAGEAAIPALIEGLEDPFWRVRHGVVQALDRVVTRSSSDPAERERLRLRVLEAGAGLEEAARAALAYLASGWPEGEDEVPELLGIIRDPGAGLELSDADPAVVTARLQAAAQVEPAALVPLLAESHAGLREEASRRLAALDDPSCLAPALAWLEDPRIPNAPAAVGELLTRLGARASGLAEQALVRGRPGGVAWAAQWIAKHPAEALHPKLLAYVDHPDAELRAVIMTTLGQLLARERGRDEVLCGHLLAGVGDPARAVRDAAVLALLDARVLAAAMVDLTGVELSAPVRVRLVRASADPQVHAAALDDAHPTVRAAAIAALAHAGQLDASARARALADPDPQVCAAALDLPAAVELLADPTRCDPALRRLAARVLVAGRAALAPGQAQSAWASMRCADDPWIRARAADLIDPHDPSADELGSLLLATCDRVAMVRLAGSARLDEVPELGERLAATLATTDDPQVQIAAWSRLIVELEPDTAEARVEQALARVRADDHELRAHLLALLSVFGAPAPAPAPTVAVVERPAGSRPSPASVASRPLGRTGIELAPLVVSGAMSLTPSSLALAAERGVDTYFWEPRYLNLTRFLRQPWRRDLQVVAGSFHADRRGLLEDLERARRQLRRARIDVFLLFWVRSPARLGAEALATLREFVERGWIRSYGFSTHDRAIACEAIASGDWPVIMTRHSAAHTGAERELLPAAAAAGVGVLGFSALCYGRMLRPSAVFERGPAAVDCYRYCLAQPAVAATISAPRRHRELEQNLAVLDDARLAADQADALVAHGAEVYADNKRFDRLLRRGGSAPLREAILELFERGSEPEPAASELEPGDRERRPA